MCGSVRGPPLRGQSPGGVTQRRAAPAPRRPPPRSPLSARPKRTQWPALERAGLDPRTGRRPSTSPKSRDLTQEDARRCGARRRASARVERALGPGGVAAGSPPRGEDTGPPPDRGVCRTSSPPREGAGQNGNDPSAGSPTETLLRLLLPLDSQVRASSERSAGAVTDSGGARPRTSLSHPIGSSDGRCVQRAGT